MRLVSTASDLHPDKGQALPRRRAPWLLSQYEDDTWLVSDTADHRSTKLIDFRFRMPDGTDLKCYPRLHTTVKEYAWWVRDVRVSRIDQAADHQQKVQNLMVIAHRMALEKIESFAHLQPFDVDKIIDASSFGKAGILQAVDRLREGLPRLVAELQGGADPFASNHGTNRISRTGDVLRRDVLSTLGLPIGTSNGAGVAALLDQYSKDLGYPSAQKRTERRKTEVVSVQTVRSILATLEHLYRMRRLTFAETISYQPFTKGVLAVAKIKGVPAARTSTAPPRLVLDLLEKATMVAAHGPTSAQHPDDFPAACWILAAAFSARRHSEINKLRAGCVLGSREDGFWLRIYIAKTVQQEQLIPIPFLVADALQKLEQATQETAGSRNPKRLFERTTTAGKVSTVSFGGQIDAFARRHCTAGSEASPVAGKIWHWHPHQFRRFFAVLFFYRYDGATLEALSHHLRHFDLQSTRRYVINDPENAAIWSDVEWGYMGELARSIVNNKRVVSGAMGERLAKTARRVTDNMRRTVRVATPERVGATLRIMMEREGLVLTPKPWVLCSCPSTQSAAAQAACRQESGVTSGVAGPDFAFAGPTVCPGCSWAVLEKRTWTVLNNELGHLEESSKASSGVDGLFRDWISARLVEVRGLVERAQDQLNEAEGGGNDGFHR